MWGSAGLIGILMAGGREGAAEGLLGLTLTVIVHWCEVIYRPAHEQPFFRFLSHDVVVQSSQATAGCWDG